MNLIILYQLTQQCAI